MALKPAVNSENGALGASMRVGEPLAQVADRVALAAIAPCVCALLSCFRPSQVPPGEFFFVYVHNDLRISRSDLDQA